MWAIVSNLPWPIIGTIFLVAVAAILWILRQIRSWAIRPNVSVPGAEPILARAAGLIEQKYIPDSYIQGRIINLLDMIPPGGVPIISNRTVEDCEIRGPTMIAPLQRATMDKCNFDGDIESIFIEVADKRNIVGAVGLKDCVFRRCRFVQIGIIGTRETVKKAKEGFITPSTT